MAKRQIKVEINNLASFAGKDIFLNIISKQGSVYLGKILEVKSEEVKIKNTKGHTLLLPIAQLDEIWAEEKVV